MKLLVLFLFGCMALVTPAAAAESLQIQGITLSEYELSASVSGQWSNGGA